VKALYTLAAVLSTLVVATPVAFGAGADPQSVLVVGIPDARHMALIANARRHGLSVRLSKPIASQQFLVVSKGNGASRVAPGEGSGLSWTSPGVLAGLLLASALVIGGVVVAARRRLGKPHTVGA
jgi:hypothetical protein